MTGRENGGRVCEAIIRLLERQTGCSRESVRRPELEPSCAADARIDCLAKVGPVRWAIEHTLVESFPGQIADGGHFTTFAGPLIEEFSSGLPTPGAYHLVIRPGTLAGIKNHEVEGVRQALRQWIVRTVPLLGEPPQHIIRETPEGAGLEVCLCRVKAPWREGRLNVLREAPPDLEERRAERFSRALAKKLPKLEKWKDASTKTVLVLEDADIALSNHVLVGDALVEVLDGRDLPDFVFLAETSTAEWLLVTLVSSGEFVSEGNYELYEFDSGKIDQLRVTA